MHGRLRRVDQNNNIPRIARSLALEFGAELDSTAVGL